MLSHYPSEINVSNNTLSFIKSLSYDGYILAGNAVANILADLDIQGDLDFWVLNNGAYLTILEEFKNKGAILFDIYSSMQDITIPGLPKINLINSNLNAVETISRFDFDYCRCLYSNTMGYMSCEECMPSIVSKTIIYPSINITEKRIRKALKYGYSFSQKFWLAFLHLLKDKFPSIHSHSHFCSYSGRCEQGHFSLENKPSNVPVSLTEDDLIPLNDFKYFEYLDPLNVNATITELIEFHRISDPNKRIFKICSLGIEQWPIVVEYVEKLIMFNPIENANYMSITSFILPNKQFNYINLSDQSYITINQIPEYLSHVNFNDLFDLHPIDRHKIIMYGEEIICPRWQKSYLNTPRLREDARTGRTSYMYSGFDETQNKDLLPELFRPYYDYIKILNHKYNQVIVNWYADQNDYIALHSDCQKEMICNYEIAIISLYANPEEYRTIVFENKKTGDRQLFNLPHGSIIKMGGHTQDEFRHGILRTETEQCARISLSFRQIRQT